MRECNAIKRVELANKQAELAIIQEELNQNIFENLPEHEELNQLKTVVKWLEIYEQEEIEDVEEVEEEDVEETENEEE